MINPLGNRLFIKPTEQDATTNMTLITNKRIYLFELHAEDTLKTGVEDKEHLTWILRFIYPGDDAISQRLTLIQYPILRPRI